MTIKEVQERIASIKDVAKSDPERAHGLKDRLYHDALEAIAERLDGPGMLAAAALEADSIELAWEACA